MTNQSKNKLAQYNVLITGASGGIGQEFGLMLFKQGANVVLIGRNTLKLEQIKEELYANNPQATNKVVIFTVDILKQEERIWLVEQLTKLPFEINLLINNAGISQFKLFEQSSDSDISNIITTNTIAPIQLTQALLPMLKSQPSAQIINVGSTYGSIGFPGYSVYCASKFALRGFSQTLSRELADSNIRVKYLSPRATKTSLNNSTVNKLNSALKSATDLPEKVAEELLSLILKNSNESYIGWPEKFFIFMNQLFPSIVSKSIIKQLPIIKKYANE